MLVVKLEHITLCNWPIYAINSSLHDFRYMFSE